MPFFSMSASEFVEAIVGIGASRVRDLFAQAKEAAPAIVFIDELDAIGRSRTSGGAGFSGGNDEREQTLNQILTRDGRLRLIDRRDRDRRDQPARRARRGAAPARPLRPAGRRPAAGPRRPRGDPARCTRGRCRSAPDVDLGRIASTRPAWSEPTSRTSSTRRRCSRRVAVTSRSPEADFTDALERIVLGAERKVMMSVEDRRRTAYHEGGHALVGMLTAGRRPGPQDLDHPARPRARRHVLRAGRGPVQLRPPRAPREDQGRARRARRRGDRVRRPRRPAPSRTSSS